MNSNKLKNKSALITMLPSLKAYDSFIKDNNGATIDSVIKFAFNKNLIHNNDQNSLKQLIINEYNGLKNKGICNISLAETSSKIVKLREIKAQINELISKNEIKLQKINISFLSNLKNCKECKTKGNRNMLRSFLFWICYNEPELIIKWNFDNIIDILGEKTYSYKEGCRVAFELFSRGEDININTINWIKEEIKKFYNDKPNSLIIKHLKSENITTCYVDLLNENNEENEFTTPKSYGKCINNAISFAYQISIKWALSNFGTKKLFLSIGIAAGEFHVIENHMKAILKEKLPDDPSIRITDFTRQCILMNEIKVIINNHPKEIEISNGEVINVWWFVGLWNTIYWDFIPEMLEEKVLQSNETLINLLWFPEDHKKKQEKFNSIEIILKYPDNTLLGLEIAKTLYYKKKFYEANELLKIILSRKPNHLIARSLRMSLFWNLGIISDTYSKANMHFRSSEEEAHFIDKNCKGLDQDYYCERGLGTLAHAMFIFRILRQNNGSSQGLDFHLSKKDVLKLLLKSETIFEKGLTVSPSGNRAFYLLLCTRSFRRVISINNDYFKDKNIQVLDNDNIFTKTAEEIFQLQGFFRNDLSEQKRSFFLNKILNKAIKTHRNGNFLQAFIPNTLFCYAVLLYDFSSVITNDIFNMTENWLNEAKQKCIYLIKNKINLYSITRFNGEILEAEIFIEHMNKIINLINKVKSSNGKMKGVKLCLINI